MNALLRLSHYIDALSTFIGKTMIWLVLAIVLISTGNALMRYLFNLGSNAFLDIQWNIFGLIFLSCAAHTLLKNEHVRIDIIAGRFSRRTQACIDIFGLLFFLAPMAILTIKLSWPVFTDAFFSREMSNSPGGLAIWPVRLMVPVGFSLLLLQALSELIKRIGFLLGQCPDPALKPTILTPEEELVQTIKAQQEEKRHA